MPKHEASVRTTQQMLYQTAPCRILSLFDLHSASRPTRAHNSARILLGPHLLGTPAVRRVDRQFDARAVILAVRTARTQSQLTSSIKATNVAKAQICSADLVSRPPPSALTEPPTNGKANRWCQRRIVMGRCIALHLHQPRQVLRVAFRSRLQRFTLERRVLWATG